MLKRIRRTLSAMFTRFGGGGGGLVVDGPRTMPAQIVRPINTSRLRELCIRKERSQAKKWRKYHESRSKNN